jgi:hypothetical protein
MTEPRRDRWGRYIIPDPETGEDREWTRATTIAGVLPDRFNLERWGERMVAYGLAQRDDLLLLAQSVQDPKADKRKLDRIARPGPELRRISGRRFTRSPSCSIRASRRRFPPWRNLT